MEVVSIKQTIGRLKMDTEVDTKRDYRLLLTDRCDACTGQAYVSVTGVTGELMFCAHHYNKVMNDPISALAMNNFAYETNDERDRLDKRQGI